MEKDMETGNPEQNTESKSNPGYLKVMLIFSVAMAALLIGVNYLFKHIF